jgi:hypothetical protein
MPRILSQSGNVIAADFNPRARFELRITSETLYRDNRVMVTRTTAFLGHEPILVIHFMGDLNTGKIVNT